MKSRHLVALLVWLLLASHALAQSLPITVTDDRGRLVTDLKSGDLILRIDGQEHPIDNLTGPRDVPLAVGILLDTSGSMEQKIRRASNAIEDFLETLDSRTEIFLMGFSDQPRLISDVTDGRPELISKLRRVGVGGETALYDGLHETLRKLDQIVQRKLYRKVIVVVTDGADSVSGITYLEVMRGLRESNVTLFAVGIPQNLAAFPMTASRSNFAGQVVIQGGRGGGGGPTLPIPLPRGGTLPIPLPVPGTTPPPLELPQPRDPEVRGETVNMSVLEAFAEATAGGAWRVEDPARRTGEPIDRIMSRISAEIRAQYMMTFSLPGDKPGEGVWHEVLITVKEPDLALRYRREYYSK